MGKKTGKVIITDEPNGMAGIEFHTDDSLREQRELLEESIRETVRQRGGSSEEIASEVAQFRLHNSALIEEEEAEELLGKRKQ